MKNSGLDFLADIPHPSPTPMETPPNPQVYDLGLVASVLDRIRLVESVDRLVGPRPGEKVSTGMALKAALLNALGFVASPLYLFGHFFQGKPTEHLLGPGITPTSSTTTAWAGCRTPWSPGCSWSGPPGLSLPGKGPPPASTSTGGRAWGKRWGPSASPTAAAGTTARTSSGGW